MNKILLCLMLLTNNMQNDVTYLKTLQIKYYQELTTTQLLKELNIPIRFNKIEFSSIPTFSSIGIKEYYLYASNLKNEYKTYSFTINVIDDIPPTIYGPEILYLENNTILDNSIILNNYNAYDEIDKNVPIFIEEISEYKTYYNVKLYTKDKSENIAQNKIKIIKNSNDFSIYIKNELELTIVKNKKYYGDELINELIKTMQIENVNYQEIIINSNSNYIQYESTGINNIDIDIKYNNHIYKINVKLNVIDNTNNGLDNLKHIVSNIYKKIIDFLSRGKNEKN